MFASANATEIKGSNKLDTSNVIGMTGWGFHFCGMFESTKTKILDLSSFDTTNTKDMHYMFKNAQATIGYARTQADANKFNNTSNKPSGLTFTVK